MLAAFSRHVALAVLLARTLVLFVLVTLAVSALRIDSPVGVVLLTAVLCAVDLRRRRETLFWSSLGYSGWQTTGVMLCVAIVAELLFAATLRAPIQMLLRSGN